MMFTPFQIGVMCFLFVCSDKTSNGIKYQFGRCPSYDLWYLTWNAHLRRAITNQLVLLLFCKTSSSLRGVKSQATCSEGAKTAATSFQSLGLFLQTLLAMDTFLGHLGKNASQCPWNLNHHYFTFLSLSL